MTSEQDPSPHCRLSMLIGTYFPVVGGGERHAQLLSEALVRQGHAVQVVTRRSSGELPSTEVLHGVRVLRVGPANQPRWGKYLMMPAACWTLWRTRKDYDVLMVCAFRVLGWVGWFVHLLLRKPVVLRAEACGEWDGGFLDNQQAQKSGWSAKLLAAYIRFRNRRFLKTGRFLSISRVIREELETGGVPPGQILDMTNGIDLSPFHPVEHAEKRQLRRDLSLPETARVYAYAGKLIRGKGVEFLIQLLDRLADHDPELHLVLVGSGEGQFLSCEKELRQQVETLNLEARVHFTGYVDNVHQYFQASDGLLFASEAESLGLVAVEAMACGLPVLVSKVGGLCDVVEDGVSGRLLPLGNLEAWESAWRDLLEDPSLAERFASAARTRVEERFDIEVIARETGLWLQSQKGSVSIHCRS